MVHQTPDWTDRAKKPAFPVPQGATDKGIRIGELVTAIIAAGMRGDERYPQRADRAVENAKWLMAALEDSV